MKLELCAYSNSCDGRYEEGDKLIITDLSSIHKHPNRYATELRFGNASIVVSTDELKRAIIAIR